MPPPLLLLFFFNFIIKAQNPRTIQKPRTKILNSNYESGVNTPLYFLFEI